MPAMAATHSPVPGSGPGPMQAHSSSHGSIQTGSSPHISNSTISSSAQNGAQSSGGPPPTKNTSHVPCKFFRQHACQAGNSCPFSHSLDPVPPCKYFLKGNCKFGPKCANLHIVADRRRPSMAGSSGQPSGLTQSPPGASTPMNPLARTHASPGTPSLLSIHARHGQLAPNNATPPQPRGLGNNGIPIGSAPHGPYESYARGIISGSPYGGLESPNGVFGGSPPDSVIGASGQDFDSPRLFSQSIGSVPVPSRAAGLLSGSIAAESLLMGKISASVGRNRDRFAASQQAFMSASVGSSQAGFVGGIPASPLGNSSSGKHLIAQESAGADSDIDEILLNRETMAKSATANLPEFDDLDSAVVDDYDSDSEFRAVAFGVRRGSLLAIPPTTARSSFSSSLRQSSLSRSLASPLSNVPASRSMSQSIPLNNNVRLGNGTSSYTTSPVITTSTSNLRMGSSPNQSSPVAGSPSRFSQFFSRGEVGLGGGGSGAIVPQPASSSVSVPTVGTPTRASGSSIRTPAAVGSPLRNQHFPQSYGGSVPRTPVSTGPQYSIGGGRDRLAGVLSEAQSATLLSVSKLAISTSYAEGAEEEECKSGGSKDLEDSRSRGSRTTDEEGAVFDMD